MKVVLAGGSGFLGQPLAASLVSGGDDVVLLTRGPAGSDEHGRRVRWQPDGTSQPSWSAEIDGADVVINLAGANIADKRWSAPRKEALRRSRVLSTRSLVAAMRASRQPPSTFISGSAIGYYGTAGDTIIDESRGPGTDFLARLCAAWEAEAEAAADVGCRVAIVRTGVVLARDGGALKKLVPAFRCFAGGPIASGRQYVSWIHRADWIAFVAWAMRQPQAAGPFNVTAPEPVTNAAFSTAIGAALGRPSWLRVPGVALSILVGELADVALVNGQRVVPTRALDLGFSFKYVDINTAMAAAVSGA